MAIEFYCPGCGKLMRTPDSTAGRKGRCPHCSTKVQIPATSITPSADGPASSQQPVNQTSGAQPAPSAQPRDPAANPSPIQFACASCHKTLRVPAANAGKKGQCPHCKVVMTIPARSLPAKKPTSQKWKGTPQPAGSSAGATTSAAPIQFTCPGCQKSVRVNASAAGQKGQCPHCKTVVTIPLKTAATPRPSASSAGLTPLGDSSGPTPLPSTPGLTPLPSTPGLAPLDDSGGLTPLAPSSAFASAPDPFASPPDLFAGLGDVRASSGFGSQDPFGGAATYPTAPVNPYSSPAPTSSYARQPSPSRSKGNRQGLPWDNKSRHEGAFMGTIKQVLFAPVEAFSAMRLSGGDSHPLIFCIYGNLIGATFFVAFRVIVDALFLIPIMLREGGGEVAVTMAIGALVGAVIMFATIMVFTVVGAFVNAGFIHLSLLVLGGANHGFETTSRVVLYTSGATALTGIIPCVGWIIQFFAKIVILSIGIAQAHETSGVKSTFAVLIPLLLYVIAVIAIIVMFFAMIASAFNAAS